MEETANIYGAGPIEGRLDLGALAGSTRTAVYLYEYVEEWMLVVAGEASVRTPDGERSVGAGELVRFPAGPQGAHKIANRGEVGCRVMMLSARRAPAVSVYPDSDKIGLWAGDDMDSELFFLRGAAVTWEHGEDGWHEA